MTAAFTIDPEIRTRFAEDGVVCLRQALAPAWIEKTRAGIERNLAQPGPFFRDHTPDGSPGRYIFDFWTWRDIPEFADLVENSPAAGIAGQLLAAKQTVLLMDNWFLRESGATNGAPWHHDEPYFDFEGRMCIFWFPLEPVEARSGLTFVKGSHRWNQLFIAPQFSENVPFNCVGEDFAPVPDIDASPDKYEFLCWDMQPGDCLVFDFRTLHSATEKDRPLDRTIHRMSLRFGAEDTIFRPRGDWTREITDHLAGLGQEAGERLETPLTPVVWRA